MTRREAGAASEPETFVEQAQGANRLVGRVLLGFGMAVMAVSITLRATTSIEFGFISLTDAAFIGLLMVVTGAATRGRGEELPV